MCHVECVMELHGRCVDGKRLTLGVLLTEQGRYEEAIGHFSQALHLNPTFVLAQNNLRVALGHLKESDKRP